jgi:2OG-Fe(II) oxygenase superfamily
MKRCICGRSARAVQLDCHDDNLGIDIPESMKGDCRLLFDNLETYGWSSIHIEIDEHSPFYRECSKPSQDLLRQHFCWKTLHENMFLVEELCIASQDEEFNNLKFIAEESGSPESGLVEAKRSWEFKPGKVVKDGKRDCNVDARNDIARRMESWTEVLKKAGTLVRKALQLPEYLVLHERGDQDGSTDNLDILRAFSYEKATHSNPAEERESTDTTIGSSPHTDWGSFTIVWQDDTPDSCLQTYCPLHDKWNDVTFSPKPERPEVLSLVVHVGDMLSLGIRRALQLKTQNNKTAEELPVLELNQVWPSPRHRVLSPISQKRNSLVYFCYPPSRETIGSIAEGLDSFCQREYATRAFTFDTFMSYDSYSILHDQSTAQGDTTNEQEASVVQRFATIINTPVVDVLNTKWRQVQR